MVVIYRVEDPCSLMDHCIFSVLSVRVACFQYLRIAMSHDLVSSFFPIKEPLTVDMGAPLVV